MSGANDVSSPHPEPRHSRWILPMAILFTAFPLSFSFRDTGASLTFLRAPWVALPMWAMALGFWSGYAKGRASAKSAA